MRTLCQWCRNEEINRKECDKCNKVSSNFMYKEIWRGS
jgi:hypothetical protein